jgi:outer membrane receptor protein involved in Fe transport
MAHGHPLHTTRTRLHGSPWAPAASILDCCRPTTKETLYPSWTGWSTHSSHGTAGAASGLPPRADAPVADDLSYSVNRTSEPTFTTPRTVRVITAADIKRNQLAPVNLHDLTSRSWADAIRVTTSWNKQIEGKTEIRKSVLTTEIRQSDSARTLGANLELGRFFGIHELHWGLDDSRDAIDSSRVDTNLVTGAAQQRRGSYTDGASYDLMAFYLQDRFDLARWLSVKLGVRYSRFSAGGSETSSVGTLDLSSSSGGLTWTVTLVGHVTKSLNLVASVTRGFRAPNIEDLSGFDQRSNGTEVPNTDLAPEKIMIYEIGGKYSSGPFSCSASCYWSYLPDLLIRKPGTCNGLPFFDLNRNGVQDGNEPSVLQERNLGEAEIKGFDRLRVC